MINLNKIVKRTSLITLGAITTLILLELTLRVIGFSYKVTNPIPSKISSDYTIFCIGESTTWGIGADNPRLNGYPAQLMALLNNYYKDTSIRCYYDMGIGQNSSEVLLKLPDYIKKYSPQCVIIMAGVNNWWNLDRSTLVFSKNEKISKIALKIHPYLKKLRIWKLFQLTKLSLGLYREHWNEGYNGKPGFWDEPEYRDRRDTIAYTYAKHDTIEMIKICRKNNIDVIVCSYLAEPDSLRKLQKQIAQEEMIPFVDNNLVFKNLKDQDQYLSSDNWHPNQKGYAIIAENIFHCIVNNKFIE
ncbi:MAG: SGNH/GDSL hydrolase family protein [Candidatus Kaelpia aquatica]|nr:SGNH/GDSL hydrolase family protein [Candidatus Kaelpia aquatica]